MRDNYAGDRSDCYKYGLLRQFCQAGLQLGIVWYLFQDKEPKAKGHGNDTGYQQKVSYQQCDPQLVEALASILTLPPSERHVGQIRTSEIFPANTVYFEEPLSFSQHQNFLTRRLHRQAWFQRALTATQACDVVYLDPDTGLEAKSNLAYQSDEGPKYLAYDEVQAFTEREQTVVIYQNRHRQPAQTIADQIRENFRLYLNFTGNIPVYYFNAGQADRMFFILPAKRHQPIVHAVLEAYNNSSWKQFFRHL